MFVENRKRAGSFALPILINMKRIFFSAGLMLCISAAFAQIDIGGKVKSKVNQRIDQRTDEAIDYSLDKAEDSVKGKNKKSKNDAGSGEGTQDADASRNDQSTSPGTTKSPGTQATDDAKLYSKYDFVPGDKIIFEDDVKNETDGEFPSKYKSTYGQGQVTVFNGEKVIQSINGSDFIPLVNGTLPERYTIEFDAYFTNDDHYINVYFTDRYNTQPVRFSRTNVVWDNFNGEVPETFDKSNRWYHVAIAVNKTMLKAYIDHVRCINVNSFDLPGTDIIFDMDCRSRGGADCEKFLVKNVRIASGGMDLYKKVTAEGKFVTHGILFDANKATLKPQSMGTLNEIAKLMKEHPELKFSIEGHTDSDGDDAANMKLSQQRADAVKKELTDMGIDASRFTTKGWGEGKPVDNNTSPEGKANNRRVEFIKQ